MKKILLIVSLLVSSTAIAGDYYSMEMTTKVCNPYSPFIKEQHKRFSGSKKNPLNDFQFRITGLKQRASMETPGITSDRLLLDSRNLGRDAKTRVTIVSPNRGTTDRSTFLAQLDDGNDILVLPDENANCLLVMTGKKSQTTFEALAVPPAKR